MDEEREVGKVAEAEEDVESVLTNSPLCPLQPELLLRVISFAGNNFEDQGCSERNKDKGSHDVVVVDKFFVELGSNIWSIKTLLIVIRLDTIESKRIFKVFKFIKSSTKILNAEQTNKSKLNKT